MFVFVAIYALSFIGFLVHWLLVRPLKYPQVIELLLLYQLVFNLGFLGMLSFFGLTFMPDRVASELGWVICPFQQELANVNLGYGVVGILSIWFRGYFWTATIISACIWLFGDGIHHFLNVVHGFDISNGKLGIIFYTDILIPLVLAVLLVMYHKTRSLNSI